MLGNTWSQGKQPFPLSSLFLAWDLDKTVDRSFLFFPNSGKALNANNILTYHNTTFIFSPQFISTPSGSHAQHHIKSGGLPFWRTVHAASHLNQKHQINTQKSYFSPVLDETNLCPDIKALRCLTHNTDQWGPSGWFHLQPDTKMRKVVTVQERIFLFWNYCNMLDCILCKWFV